LRPEHIYLGASPAAIDCIEFNAEFRQLDVLDELSFLAVECALLGADEVGGRILEEYCRSTGDNPSRGLLPFYRSYRASVRAKVHVLRAQQVTGSARTMALGAARSYLTLADHYAAELGPPLLVVVRGLTGTGKSTLATELSESLRIGLLQTDAVRRELFGPSEQPTAFDQDKYRADKRLKVYDEMLKQASGLLEKGVSVVLDGTFLSANLRARAMLLARRHSAAPVFIECRCPEDIAAGRIGTRLTASQGLSESRPEFVRLQREQEEPDPPGVISCSVNTTASMPAMLASVFQHIKKTLS
jgi:predicted kinase